MMRFSLFLLVRVFMAIAITHGLLINQKSALLPKKQQSLSNRSRQINTSLNLDLFGFGPAEIGVVVVVGLVLFG